MSAPLFTGPFSFQIAKSFPEEYNEGMKSFLNLIIIAILAVACFTAGYGIAVSLQPPIGNVSVSNMPSDAHIIPVSIVSLNENASSSASISIEYPQFPSLPKAFNDTIASSTLSRLAQFKKDIADNEAVRQATADPSADLPPSAYSFIATWQESRIDDKYVSFIVRYDEYIGGANEDQEIETFNYDVANSRNVAIADLFPNVADPLSRISALVRDDLHSSLMQASPGYDPDAMLNAGTEPLAENFPNFTFTDYAVTFYFPKYAVAPGSFGEQKAMISRSDIK